MAQYKVIETSSGLIFNIVELNDTGSFDIGTGYRLEEVTASFPWTGSVAQDQFTSVDPYMGGFIGLFSGQLDGEIVGTLTGSVSGSTTGSLTGSLTGSHSGSGTGSYTGSFTGSFNDYSGSLGWLDDFRSGFFKSGSNISFTGSISGSATGSFTGSYTGSYTGSFTGSYTGSFTGSLNGTASNALTASFLIGGAGASVTGPGNDRLISSDGTSTGLIAESNLSFNGSLLNVTGSIQMSNPGELRTPVIVGPDEKMTTLTVAGNGVGGTVTFDLTNGPVFRLTMDGNVTNFTTSNDPPSGTAASFTLIIIGNGTAYAAAWNAKFYWPGGAPAIPSTLDNASVFVFTTFDQGGSYLGLVAADNVAGGL